MRAISRAMMMGAFLGLAGCAGLGGTFHAEDFIGQNIQGSDFNAHLAREYQSVARLEAKEHVNWYQSGLYTNKGLAAMGGETVLPWEPADFGVGGDADAWRNDLLAALDANRSARPEACARAQVMYDAYLHASDSVYPPTPAERAEQFKDALAACKGGAPVAAPAAPNAFTIYFGFDKYNLTAEAQRVVDSIVSALRGMAAPRVTVDGHTDTAGPSAYNLGLGDRRAKAVQKALTDRGVGAGAISTDTLGESQLAVPTADGTPEPLNRRAVITIK
ncbi:OmpA family protein [Futiania mangrovi]|uniref:OmpA family protein n=1 Tax=Futiania mangrovi TaxID=2959716 RepID=A0A9J6PE02_9PROT|nr:OmpA family protein [Futiania mangrovii]MCP1334847.1 OmpA family protein [Futiania mangrovii]